MSFVVNGLPRKLPHLPSSAISATVLRNAWRKQRNYKLLIIYHMDGIKSQLARQWYLCEECKKQQANRQDCSMDGYLSSLLCCSISVEPFKRHFKTFSMPSTRDYTNTIETIQTPGNDWKALWTKYLVHFGLPTLLLNINTTKISCFYWSTQTPAGKLKTFTIWY